jgi:transglutaminase-like putative cysteine protease
MTRQIPLISPLWQRIEATPKPIVEESIQLRVFVQLLVVMGIIATDIAIEEPRHLWAIPVSLLGAAWSRWRRHRRNIPIKFCIALGMLVALAAFFGRLLGELNDTRVVLAELLIHLQVLHSFDLPRRKDLGYSMVIGLILLGVAATLSQTFAFAPVVLVFLAIALPTLIFDYRSRLGLSGLNKLSQSSSPTEKSPSLNYKFLIVSFLSIVFLGLAIFALLPRFPSYQLRSFPVSSPLDMPEGEFNGSQVFNPGYVSEGEETDDSEGSGGRSPRSGPGALNTAFYYGFDTQINQNLRGQLIPQVVMRVRSQAPGFWRVVGFDEYTSQGWNISRNERTVELKRPSWSYQFRLLPRPTQAETREIVQSYTILSQLPNLLPALTWPQEVYFPTDELAIDTEGTLRSPLTLREGLTYTVVSRVPYRDRNLLTQAPTQYPDNITDYYLQIPDNIKQKVKQKTEEILSNPNSISKTPESLDFPYEKALFLAQYLKQNPNYKLQDEPPFLQRNEDLVEAFLFGYKDSPAGETITGGYPDHFATVLTMMLRSIGIPARVAGGFQPGEFNPFTGLYVVRNTDAHLITEVYFPSYGWFMFNPIPGMDLIPPSIERNQTFSALQAFWDWIAGWLPSPVKNILQTVFGRFILILFRSIRWFFQQFTQGWLGLFRGLGIAILLSFLGWLSWTQLSAWRERWRLAKLPVMERIYQQMLNILTEQGYPKPASQTPWEYAQFIQQQPSVTQPEIIDQICQAYVRWRYGSQTVNVQRLQQQLQLLKKSQIKRFRQRILRNR